MQHGNFVTNRIASVHTCLFNRGFFTHWIMDTIYPNRPLNNLLSAYHSYINYVGERFWFISGSASQLQYNHRRRVCLDVHSTYLLNRKYPQTATISRIQRLDNQILIFIHNFLSCTIIVTGHMHHNKRNYPDTALVFSGVHIHLCIPFSLYISKSTIFSWFNTYPYNFHSANSLYVSSSLAIRVFQTILQYQIISLFPIHGFLTISPCVDSDFHYAPSSPY